MSTTRRAFREALYREHLEEASFLFAQIETLRQADALPWTALANFEERLEAHLDALVVGDEAALDICRERATAGDDGELFAAVAVFCRQARADLMAHAVQAVPADAPERIEALSRALEDELPAAWTPFVERALLRHDPLLTPVLARVAGHRRLAVGGALQCFGASEGAHVPAVAQALGTLRCREAEALLSTWSQIAEPAIAAAASQALLQLGARADTVLPSATTADAAWAVDAWARVGGPLAAHALAMAATPLSPHRLLALGLLGDPHSVAVLLEHLQWPSHAAAAATALQWLTGAPLFEERFVEAPPHEDEWFDEEKTAYQACGTPPRRPDGAAYGQVRRVLSVDPLQWRDWWSKNQSRFAPQRRHRGGLLVTPRVLLDNLMDARSDPRLREAAADELALRYGCELPFSTRWRVAAQQRALRAMATWADAAASRFEPGRWYASGLVH